MLKREKILISLQIEVYFGHYHIYVNRHKNILYIMI